MDKEAGLFKMKICLKCNTIKQDDGFHKNKSRGTGLSDWCKKCKAKDSKLKYHAIMPPSTLTEKTCSKCKTLKPIGKFYKDNKYFDGYRNPCRDCASKARRIYKKRNQAKFKLIYKNYRLKKAWKSIIKYFFL